MADRSWVLIATLFFLPTFLKATSEECLMSVITHVGQPVTLLCPSGSDADVIWTYHDVRIGKVKDIYSHGKIINGNVGRFELDSSVGNRRSLKLNVSRARDAGLYSCIEEDGLGDTHFVLLNVVGDETVEPDVALDVTTSRENTQVSEETICPVPRITTDHQIVLVVLIALIFILALSVATLVGFHVRYVRRLKKEQAFKNNNNYSPRSGSIRIAVSPTVENLLLLDPGSQLHAHGSDNNADIQSMDYVMNCGNAVHAKIRGAILTKAMIAYFIKLKTKTELSDVFAVNAIRSVCGVWSSATVSQTDRKALRGSLQRVSNRYRHRPLPLKSINEPDSDVCAFTKLKDFVYIVRNQAIDQYDLKFNFVRSKTLFELEVKLVIAGFTGNKHDGYMYLGDNKKRCVWKLDFTNHRPWSRTAVHLNPWFQLHKSTENIHSLCMVPGGDIGVLVGHDYYSGKLWKGQVLIIRSNGSVVSHINLSPDIVQPCGIAVGNNENIIVTYRDDPDGGIVEVNKLGRITSTCRTMREPRRCHYDEKGNTLFAIDTRSNKVLLYDMQFRLLRVLIEFVPANKYDVDRRPARILYSSSQSLLFVQMLSGRILAYRY